MSETTKKTKKKYWKSLDQWTNSSEFKALAEKEFISSPLSEETQEGRRDFLKLMGASLSLASFGCVRRPAQKIVPFVNRPEGLVHGIANHYASSLVESGEVSGLVVKTREGKPIKLEGNEFFPEVGEALSARGQAQLLSLYDPDRLQAPIQNLLNKERTNKDTVSTTWNKVDKELVKKISQGGVYVLSGDNPSEASRDLIESFVKKFNGKYYKWSCTSYSKLKKSFKEVYGSQVGNSLPRYKIESSKIILSVGTDFLNEAYGALALERAWGKRRNPVKGEPVRLYQVESIMSLTGTNADKRLPLASSKYLSFLCSVVSSLSDGSVYAKKASSFEGIKSLTEDELTFAKEVSSQLKKNAGKSIIMGFGHDAQNVDYVEIQKAVHYLNSYLGNDGRTIDYSQAPYVSFNSDEDSLSTLISEMNAGKVKTLFIYDTNLLYTHPNKALKKALINVGTVIYVGDRNDETGSSSHYVLPDDHALEKWNEFESMKGIYSVAQPTIQPLYNTRAFESSLLKWMGSKKTWYDQVKASWKKRYKDHRLQSGYESFDEFWVGLLQKGVWDLSEFKNSVKSSRTFSGSFKGSYKESKGPRLTVYKSSAIGEGKLSNVSWLQELPDPVTKIVWDNYLSVSLDYAKEMGLKEGDVVEVKGAAYIITLPVHIQPGQETKTVSVAMGYGRKGAGKVCEGIGANACLMVQNHRHSNLEVEVRKTGKTYKLANVQGHHTMEGRAIVNEASYKEYKKDPSSGIHRHKVISLWSKHKYPGHKWGMSVDLSTCTGCSACVVACQAENNIPVVGKKHILNGREMHWIRIDRYYEGDPKNPRTLHQPVMCQHCDNAPCETVCPVLATVHGSEGTNDMVYNRCVGTRYCSNNCPYKVRRFNWFNYSKVESPLKMALNPEVTVRSRGVMEKCTFCIQKINEVKSKAKLQDRKPRDGEIKPSCQQTCPTNAITFGDMNDPEAKVSKKFKDKRTYVLLEELNVGPAVRYMTKIWNTNKEIAGDHHGSEKHEGDKHKKHDEGHKERHS